MRATCLIFLARQLINRIFLRLYMQFQNQNPLKLVKSAIFMMDIGMMVLAAIIASYLKFGTTTLQKEYLVLVGIACFVQYAVSTKVYQMWRGNSRYSIYWRAIISWLIVINIIFTLLVMAKLAELFSRQWFLFWSIIAITLFISYRIILFKALVSFGIDGVVKKRILILGASEVQRELVRRASESNWSGYSLYGILDVAEVSRIELILSNTNLHEVWVCTNFQNNVDIKKVIELFNLSTTTIRIIPDLSGLTLLNAGRSSVLGLPCIDISVSHMSGINLVVKWLEDKCLSIAIIILILPVLLAIATAIKLTSKGPVIFKQKRHGWNGKIITVYKFRTMKNAIQTDVVEQAKLNDSRVTPLGAFLRKSSLDELPQFFNVLLGEMSIVGPRPHAVQHNEVYMRRINSYMLRHKVKPGITGWAQINGYRGETDVDSKMIARVQYDLYYIERWSLWFDLSIILKTIVCVFRDRNAY